MNGITGILSGIVAGIGSLLSGLKSGGVNIGSAGDLVLQDIAASEVDEQNYLNGQAVVIGTFSYDSQPGTIVAVKNGGPAAASLGL